MLTVLTLTLHQIVALVAPTLALTVALHLSERARSRVAAWRWGFRSVLVTAWLGAPLHELSHAVVHRLFQHDVRKLVLFDPDPDTGCLGYIEYAFDPKSLPQRIGRFFAGIAPLLGGTLVLWIVGSFLLDDAARWFPTGASARALASADGPIDGLLAFARVTRNTVGALTDPDNLTRPTFWVFLYVSACVVSHMAPSRADLTGAQPGALCLGLVVLVVNLVATLLGASSRSVIQGFIAFAAPVVGLLGYALALSLIVLGITSFFALISLVASTRRPPDPADPDTRRAALSLGVVLLSLLALMTFAPRPRHRRHTRSRR